MHFALNLEVGRGDVDLYRLDETGSASGLLLSPLLGIALGLIVVKLSRWATLAYAWAINENGSVSGLYLVAVILAVLLDLGVLGGVVDRGGHAVELVQAPFDA